MARLDSGCAVLVGEVADGAAHVDGGEAVDGAGDDGVEVQGCEEFADVVDGVRRDGAVCDRDWRDRGGFPVAREEG